MIIVFLVCLTLLLIILHEYAQKCSSRWKKISEFPGDTTIPLFGNSLQLGFDADEASHRLMAVWKKHGKQNFRFTVGSEHWILLSDPDDVKIILSHPTELSKISDRNVAMRPFFGNSVSSSEGERWRLSRKLMSPSFHFRTLSTRAKDVNRLSERLFDIIDSYDGAHVDLYRYLKPFMFDLVCSNLMGVESNLLANPDHPYLQVGTKVIKLITFNIFSYWRNIPFLLMLTPIYSDMMDAIKTIRETTKDVIMERRNKLKQIRDDMLKNNKSFKDTLELLIDKKISDGACLLDNILLSRLPNGEPIPDEVIDDETTLICFTGYYTSSITMSHTLYHLAKYPEIQQEVLQEQKAIFNKDFNRPATNQDLSEMKFLEAVIKETIRLIPTVTKIGRQLKNDLKFKDGRVAPAGTSVIVFYEALYQNPKVFPEPEKYRPERHLEPMHTYALVPFSSGPRNCLGFRYAWVVMKATLSNILRRYEVIPGETGTEPQFVSRLLTESKNGVRLRFKKRIL